MSLHLVYDHRQRRQRDDRIGLLAGGLDLNGTQWSNVWIEPVTKTLILRPGPRFDAWQTTSTGIYARLGKSDYTLNDATKWEEHNSNGAASKYLHLKDSAAGSADRSAITTTTWTKNRGFWLSWFASNWGDDRFVAMECGWSNTVGAATGVSLRFYSTGEAEVWKDNAILAFYKISGFTGGHQTASSYVSVLLIPGRRRELTVVSNQGDGFSHVFDDIAEDAADPAITGATKFWWKVPAGLAQVECAPLQYSASGYATSLLYEMAEAPVPADVYETWDNAAFAGGLARPWRIFGDPAYAGTTGASASLRKHNDAATLFVADGNEKRCTVRVDLTGDGLYTPFVYGAQIGFAAQPDETDGGASFDAVSKALSLSLEVPEEPSDVGFDAVLKSPDVVGASVSKLLVVSNRPCKVALGTGASEVVLLDGLTEAVSWTEAISDEARRVHLTVRDGWKALENYIFRERLCLDGLALETALRKVVELVLHDSVSYDLDATGFTIGEVPLAECGEFNAVCEVGDRASEWVTALVEDYAANWFYGLVPTAAGVAFQFKDPNLLSVTPEATLYDTVADYLAATSQSADPLAWKHTYRNYRERRLEPEANDVRVTGWDPRARKAFQTWKPDTASMEVSTPPALRPDNWLGAKRRYGLIDPKITTQEMADTATELLSERLTKVRVFAEWESNMLLRTDGAPVWRGRVVRLDGKGDFRVVSFRTEFGLDDGVLHAGYSEEHVSRPSTYVGEKLL